MKTPEEILKDKRIYTYDELKCRTNTFVCSGNFVDLKDVKQALKAERNETAKNKFLEKQSLDKKVEKIIETIKGMDIPKGKNYVLEVIDKAFKGDRK